MKGQGFGNLWLLAIGMIGLFVLATIIAPALINPNNNGSDNNDGNDDLPEGEVRFNAPSTNLSSTALSVNQLVYFSIDASPQDNTTGSRGSYAWILMLNGADGRVDTALLTFGQQEVSWSAGEGSSLIGLGPRFSLGAGATSVDVHSDLTLAMTRSGNYTIRIWIAETTGVTSQDPNDLTAVSPASWVSFEVKDVMPATISMTQDLDAPTGIIWARTWNEFSVSDVATTTGMWTGTIVDYIAFEKSNIAIVDVQVRIPTSTGYNFLSWKDSGDRLVGELVRTSPFAGTSIQESAQWITNFDVYFGTTGSILMEVWSAEQGTGKVLTKTIKQNIEVNGFILAPPSIPADNASSDTESANYYHLPSMAVAPSSFYSASTTKYPKA